MRFQFNRKWRVKEGVGNGDDIHIARISFVYKSSEILSTDYFSYTYITSQQINQTKVNRCFEGPTSHSTNKNIIRSNLFP